jgi:hypothetical protein
MSTKGNKNGFIEVKGPKKQRKQMSAPKQQMSAPKQQMSAPKQQISAPKQQMSAPIPQIVELDKLYPHDSETDLSLTPFVAKIITEKEEKHYLISWISSFCALMRVLRPFRTWLKFCNLKDFSISAKQHEVMHDDSDWNPEKFTALWMIQLEWNKTAFEVLERAALWVCGRTFEADDEENLQFIVVGLRVSSRERHMRLSLVLKNKYGTDFEFYADARRIGSIFAGIIANSQKEVAYTSLKMPQTSRSEYHIPSLHLFRVGIDSYTATAITINMEKFIGYENVALP